MNKQRIVRDVATQKEYELKAESGRGMTSVVFEAVARSGDESPVAVKVAYEGMSADEKQLFWDELNVLKALSGSDHVPSGARRGEFLAQQDSRPDSEKTGVIIQELVPRDWLLRSQITGPKHEALALVAASQYATLLDYMFWHGVTTRGDRKLPDLNWDPSNERLIVLDWNRAVVDGLLQGQEDPAAVEQRLWQELTQSDNSQKTAQLRDEIDRLVVHRSHILTDIRLFGRMWGQLLGVSELNSDRLPVLEDEVAWGDLSLGMRYLLSTAVQSRKSWGFQEPKQLREAIDRHLVRWQQSAEMLLTQAQELRGVASTQMLWERVKIAETVLILCDLIERKWHGGEDDRGQFLSSSAVGDNLDELRTWANSLTNEINGRFSERVRTIHYYLDLSLFDQATRIIQEARSEFLGSKSPMPYYQVILHRLTIATKVGETGSHELKLTDMGQRLQSLRSYLDALAQATSLKGLVPDFLPQAVKKWPTADLNKERLGEVIQPLHIELELWQAVARNEPEQLNHHWRALWQLNEPYAMALKAAFADLDEALTTWEADDAGKRSLSVQKEAFSDAVEGLCQVLFDRANSMERDLDAFIRPCEEAYFALIKTTDEEKEAYNFVARVRSINEYLGRGDLSAVLDVLQKPGEYANQTVLQQKVTQIVLMRLKAKAKKCRWPSDLGDAQSLLSRMPLELVHRNAKFQSTYKEVQEFLAKWEKVFHHYRNAVGITDDNLEERYYELANNLGDVDEKAKIDKYLRSAVDHNIELFKPERSVASLIAKRESIHLQRRLEALTESISRFSEKLAPRQVATEQPMLIKKISEFQQLSTEIDVILKQVESLNLDTRVNQIIDQLGFLHDLYDQLGVVAPDPSQTSVAIEERLRHYDEQLEIINQRISGWQLTPLAELANLPMESLIAQTTILNDATRPLPDNDDSFEQLWGNYIKLSDTPATLAERREKVREMLRLQPQSTKQVILIAQEEDELRERRAINDTLTVLARDWQSISETNSNLAGKFHSVLSNNLMSKTTKYLKDCRSRKLPDTYVAPIQGPIQILNHALKLEELQDWIKNGQEGLLTTALWIRRVAKTLDHWANSTTAVSANHQPDNSL